jgi:glycosyltransferase involved in cell wall biosynthesis
MVAAQLPRVTLCLLTYRRAKVLPRTLDSLLAQSHQDFELIINDDCSPDETEAICRDYARRDARVRYCRNPRNLRYAGNQNAALRRAQTEYVGIVHDGDLYRHDMLEKWTAALVAHPSAALVFSKAERLDTDGRVVDVFKHAPYAELIPGFALLDELLQSPGSPIFGIVMVRRSRVLDAGPFDPRMPVLADIDMWMRLLARHDAAYVPEALYAIAPREGDHHNNYTNWRVRHEQELIHALNLRRRSEADPDADRAARQRRAISAMFWRARVSSLLACVRHVQPSAFASGIKFILDKRSPLRLDDEPDRALDWNAVDRSLVP